ncbi:hypothetical protein AB0O28_14970 [Microbispora sp. NPDC088329]|uniref:hypothetical protein n=1 Tax=Microbispora sp. NPDC088329 TaxID=3154869 RepID=UPI0034173574
MPPPLAVVPAGFVSIIITVAGLTYIRWTIAGRFALDEWGAWLPECFWPIWGGALAVATVSYHLRRKREGHPAEAGRDIGRRRRPGDGEHVREAVLTGLRRRTGAHGERVTRRLPGTESA